MKHGIFFGLLLACVILASCSDSGSKASPEFFGTLEPFATEAMYFVVTDRFVDGDPSNNYPDQGGEERGTFDRPIQIEDNPPGNIGYLGGDFKGVLDNAAYIADMGFTSIWLTPIVDNPDEAFTGGAVPGAGGSNDKGKTGYHGYWGVNFFAVDEHLPSEGLDYRTLTATLKDDHGIKTVLDVVCNHGSPAFSMESDQPKYGELYDADGVLVADHQNLHPTELDDANPLHAFYRHEPDLAELSDLDYDNPDVLDYCANAQVHWLSKGADAVRIDTIKHMPHKFWADFAKRLRQHDPQLFLFAEAWTYEAEELAEYTYNKNGRISVLDFPGQQAMAKVFGKTGGSYADLVAHLHLDTGIYQNPYELMSFYDNHDMRRLDADENGFIDANNWLFTTRGIPIVYYGSEIGFRAGRDQHEGNRDYFGMENVKRASTSPIHAALRSITQIRQGSPALQRGLQANLRMEKDLAQFFRVFQKDSVEQTALVLLNKSDSAMTQQVDQWLSEGQWRDAVSGDVFEVSKDISVEVPAHGFRVLFFDGAVNNPELTTELKRLQSLAERSN